MFLEPLFPKPALPKMPDLGAALDHVLAPFVGAAGELRTAIIVLLLLAIANLILVLAILCREK